MSEAPQQVKPMKFASLQKFLLFCNVGKEKHESFVFSATIVNETKIRFSVNYSAKKLNVGFSFYLIDFIPWLLEAADSIRSLKPDEKIKEISFGGTLPEAYMQPGKASGMVLTIGEDDEGPFIETNFKGVDPFISVVRFRFKPIPGYVTMVDGAISQAQEHVRLYTYLEQLAFTAETVGAYVSAINANEWTPPVTSDTVIEAKDSDIPY